MPYYYVSGGLTKILSYATDEDVFQRASRDFFALAGDNLWSYGVDGVIPADDPWALRSTVVDFAQVLPGALVRLDRPSEVFGEDGEVFAVDSVDAIDTHTLHLRRVGVIPGGSPPGYPGAETDGVEFTVATLLPQLVEASASLDAKYEIGPTPTTTANPIAPQTRENLETWSLQELKEMCIWTVLRQQYIDRAEAIGMVGGVMDVFAGKAAIAERMLNAKLATVRPRYVGGGETDWQPRWCRLSRV